MNYQLPNFKEYIGNKNINLWFPGFINRISTLDENYNTSFFTTKSDPKKIWKIESKFIKTQIELLSDNFYKNSKEKESDFSNKKEIDQSIDLINSSISIIDEIPSLAKTINQLVKSIHILKKEEFGYDKSFSLPTIPYSIFLNISEGKYNQIRIAEAIIHEAMHLQLTIIEKNYPLFKDNKSLYYSPWKKSERPISGLMHALYVFKVINEWLYKLSLKNNNWNDYSKKRFLEIEEEIKIVNSSDFYNNLTDEGIILLNRIIYCGDKNGICK